MKTNYTYLLLLSLFISFGQQPKKDIDINDVEEDDFYYFIEGDSIYKNSIELEEINLIPKLNLTSNIEKKQYYILRRKARKVYPYAKMAQDTLSVLYKEFEEVKSKRKKKKITKKVQKYIKENLTDELKKLTRTEGQILVKLINRQTGETAFDLVKELRSGMKAFALNTTASLFNISLKEIYDPENVKEDYYIEDILQRSFNDGILEKQKHKLDFDFYSLENKWIFKF